MRRAVNTDGEAHDGLLDDVGVGAVEARHVRRDHGPDDEPARDQRGALQQRQLRARGRGDEKPPKFRRAASVGLAGATLLVPFCLAAVSSLSRGSFFR